MNKKTLSILSLGLLLGGASIGAYQVAAQTSTAQQIISPEAQEIQDPSYQGSIAVDAKKYEGKSEAEESKALASEAKISADQAKQFAEAKVGGTASDIELGSENGSLVYEVKIGRQEVKVDAGDGSVLKVEQDDNEKEEVESENEKGGDIEKNGVDHQFEGEEEHED